MVEGSARGNPPHVDVLKSWLVRELARVVDVSEQAIAINEPFSRFGLDSVKAIGLLRHLSEFLDRQVPITLAWSHPTIEKLSNHLCGDPELKSEVLSGHSTALRVGNQPIAVIGLSCRFPGASDPAAFWELLRSGRTAIREITPDRWDIGAWYDPDPHKPGKMNSRQAGLLETIDQFDPGFFGISPREAIQMDPQQRLAMELAWEALETAGIRSGTLRGSRTGVFVGVVWHDYEALARKAGEEITMHTGTGRAFSIVANRISYWLGLQGPSIAVDTACSSSLVSVHLACRSLQFGDATLALAGGVNLIIDPERMVALSKFGGLSGTGQSRAFDSNADGFVRGEGGGFVVLKSLNRALADGDPIYAVIRGTAVNNDGASNGLTAPNPLAQELVLQHAVADAGIKTTDIHYVEAHGTGTQLGDPIEASALGNVLGTDRTQDQPLLIGSVKTNIGHLEGAAGVAGLIKLVLSVKHRRIPPSLNFESPNRHIDFEKANLRVVTTLEPWPEPTKPAIGGVSSFGWGGTNCHVIVEEAVRSKAHLLPLGASDRDSLHIIAGELKKYLSAGSSSLSLADVCATAAARCTPHPERLALTARSIDELVDQLEAFLQGQKCPGIAVGHRVSGRPKLAFVFSPQGSQWIGMGKSLIASEPIFRAKLAECDRSLTRLTGWSLFDLLLAAPDELRFGGVEFIQPALTAIQVALAELWNSWGVRPDYVATHSMGEWAGAFAAGALSVEETMRIAVEASRAQSSGSPDGGMAVVELPEQEVIERIKEWAGAIFVGGQNSATSTILSGNADFLKSLIATWKNEGLTCSMIAVDVAAHSPCMDGVLERLKVSLDGLRPRRMAIPLVSSATGVADSDSDLGPEHWARKIRQQVLFTPVAEQLAKEGCAVFLEISPHPILLSGIRQTLGALGVDGVTLASCWRGADERESLLASLGTLYSLGWAIDWDAVAQGGRKDFALPISVPEGATGTPSDISKKAPWLLPLSGHTTIALRDRARSIAECLRKRPETSLDDFVYTLGVTREPLEHRLAVVGVDREKLASILEGVARTEDFFDPNLIRGRTHPDAVPRVAFVCSGQGPQWQGMGRELMASIPVFRQEIVRCADEIKRHVSWDLLEELERDEAGSRLQETQIAQPALFALQVALAAVWRSWGIQPDALVGHSAGEVAAAHLSGALSFEDAVTVICCRGRLMQRATGLGKMAALEITETKAEDLLCVYRDRISLAAVNSPTSIVVSGEADAIEQIVETVVSQGVRAKVLPVDYAFHSPQMEPFQLEMSQSISGLRLDPPSIAVYSIVTGALATGEDFDANYWARNIRQPVQFATAIRAMLAAGHDTFVELSPHPVLSGMIAQCADAALKSTQQLPSLRRGVSDSVQMLRSLGALFTSGRNVDWTGVHPKGGRVVALPVYPWQRKRFWLDRISAAGLHPLAARRISSPSLKDLVFESEISATSHPFLEDHRLLGRMIFPATGYVEAVRAAAGLGLEKNSWAIENLVIGEALALDDTETKRLQVVLSRHQDGTVCFEVFSSRVTQHAAEDTWRLHASGNLVARENLAAAMIDLDAFRRDAEEFGPERFYAGYQRRGIDFGARFRGVTRVWRRAGQALGLIEAPLLLGRECNGYAVHPALLDACIQVVTGAVGDIDADSELFLPLGIESIRVFEAPAGKLWSVASIEGDSPNQETFKARFQIADERGRLVAEVRGMSFKRTESAALERAIQRNVDDWLYETVWVPLVASKTAASESVATKSSGELVYNPENSVCRQPSLLPTARHRRWLILGDQAGTGQRLADFLAGRGDQPALACVQDGAIIDRSRADENLGSVRQSGFDRLMDRYFRRDDAPLDGVIYLWPLDASVENFAATGCEHETEFYCGAALQLVQALVRHAGTQPPRLWLCTRGVHKADPVDRAFSPAGAAVWGLGKVIGLEHPEFCCVRLDLDPSGTDTIESLAATLDAEPVENEIAIRSGRELGARLQRLRKAAVPTTDPIARFVGRPYELTFSSRGSLENLKLDLRERRSPGRGEVEIRVHAAALNFRDVMNVMGLYPGDAGPLGAECAGEIVALGHGVTEFALGDKVVGLAPGSFGAYVTTPAALVAPKPARVSFDAAVTLPVAYVTAYFTLHHLGKLQPAETVLIHAGAGGVGLAAVTLAKRSGAEIFATAGSPEKRALLKSMGVAHVLDSRSLDFAAQILDLTNGRGVDVVLNSLADQFVDHSFQVIARNGRFLEIGKRGIWEPARVASLGRGIQYHIVDWSVDARENPELIGFMLRELMAAVDRDELDPLPHRVFPLREAEAAFRFMAQGRHAGKVVLSHVETLRPKTTFSLDADGTYLITGGFRGVGLMAARWLVDRGARHLVLTGRQIPELTNSTFQAIQARGVQLRCVQADVSDEKAMWRVLDDLRETMPPLRGVIHSAGMLDDGILLQQSWERFATVFAPKVAGSLVLHRLTASDSLDFCVFFSSIAAVFGSPGQGSYAAANAFLNCLAQARNAAGKPSVSVNWGAWAGAGMAVDRGLISRAQESGYGVLEPGAGFQALETALMTRRPQVMISPVNWPTFLRHSQPGGHSPAFLNDFIHAASSVDQRSSDQSEIGEAVDVRTERGLSKSAAFRQRLDAVAPNRRRSIVLEQTLNEVAHVLGLQNPESLPNNKPLREFGLDSLMAVELRNRLGDAVGQSLPATLLFDYPTLDGLTEYLSRDALKLEETESPNQTAANSAGLDLLSQIEGLDDAEIDVLFESKGIGSTATE